MFATAASARAERPPRRTPVAFWLAAALALAACASDDARPPAAAVESAAPGNERAAAPDGSGGIGGGEQTALAPAAAVAAPAEPPPPDAPPPPAAAPPPNPMELDRAALQALMGRPAFAWEQPGAAMWRYDGPGCELFVFLHGGRVRHVEAQGEDAARREACLARLLAARP